MSATLVVAQAVFLINAFEYIREAIRHDLEQQKEAIKTHYFDETYENASDSQKIEIEARVDNLFSELNNELNLDNQNSRLYQLSHNCIYGTDANPRMARVSKMNMIMHGDGHGGVHHNDGLLNINGIFEERFDVILTNPPFGSRVAKDLKLTQEDSLIGKPHYENWKAKYDNYEQIGEQREQEIANGTAIVDKFEVSQYSTLTEVMFIDRCLNLLRKGGRMGIVLPEGVLNNSDLQKARHYFEGRAKIMLITSIPQDVFIASGATVKPSLVFLKRFTESEEQAYLQAKTESEQEIGKKYTEQKTQLETLIAKKADKLPAKASDEQKAEHKAKQEALKAAKKQAKADLSALEAQIKTEVRELIKAKFDYEIPLAEVEKAGIDSKGAAIESELPALKAEYGQYRKSAKLWDNLTACRYVYSENNGKLDRTLVQQGAENV